ncbi:SprT family zinc-dependent metalloprotease [Mesoplasma photuris]|uniref:YgjP family zinc-dependent metalloprotease n=1 Tax=Mesoplasma photuris TaxID=217731 RepID=UPI0004E0D090|nr:SprT family zinc-dependent metalloprotease [Mesoplasma photuris]
MADIKKQLSLKGEMINYYVKYGNQKNIILRVREGKILVSAPINVNDWEIEQLIYKNISKITSVQNNYEVRQKYDLFGMNPWVKIFDNDVNIFIHDENIHSKKDIDGIHMKNYKDLNIQLDKMYNFLAKEYKNWFIYRSNQWASIMGVNFKNLTVKEMNLKWGVCYPSQEKIIFNTKLLHFRIEIIDYVIVHELAHLKFANHSKDFWWTVEKYLPNYRELQKELNSAGL